MISIEMNGKSEEVDVSQGVSLPWVTREYLRFRGTKVGCGIALFGASTVHLDGRAQAAPKHFPTLPLRRMTNGERKGEIS